MGKKLSLARKTEKRRSVLLARGRTGESGISSSSRDQRQEEANTAKGAKRRKVKDTSPESQSSPEAGGADDSTRPEGRGRDNKDRKPSRRDEGKDSKPRRSAKELGIIFPGSHCDEAFTEPHLWIGVDKVEKGILLRCVKCLRHIWLPATFMDAERLSYLIRKYGNTDGYCKCLDRHRAAKVLVAKLQDLWHVRRIVTDDNEFVKLAVGVMKDTEYDRKEV